MDKITIGPRIGHRWRVVQVPAKTQFWFLTATSLRDDAPGIVTVNDRPVVAVERGTVYLNYSAPAGSVIRVTDCILRVMNATDEAVAKIQEGRIASDRGFETLEKFLKGATMALITFCAVYFGIAMFR